MSTEIKGPWKERVATGTADRMISGPDGGVCVIPYRYGTPERRAALSRIIRAAPAYEVAWGMVPEEIRERILSAVDPWVSEAIDAHAKAEGR